jgi:hypothetical protein
MNANLLLLRLLLGGVIALAVLPRAAASDNDPSLPGNGFSASRYETLWLKSPFSVASADGSAPESPDYSLVGIAEFDGISYASIIDKKNNLEHFLISSEQDSHGLKLISVTRGNDAGSTLAMLQKNGEPLTLKLDISAGSAVAGGPGASVIPTPVIQMPGAVPAQIPSRPDYFTPGQPPPVIYRPHMITIPPPPGQPRNFQFRSQPVPNPATPP